MAITAATAAMPATTAHVLYVDHQGHPAPLSRCYHATASRRLSSSVDRHPPSTITEVDSAYCPQCLSFHDVATATSLGFCPRPTCRKCPICTAVAVVAVLESNTCEYKCGYCPWTSIECGVISTVVPADDGSIGKPQLVKATEELVKPLQEKVSESNSAVESHYQTMLKAWEAVAKDEVRRHIVGAGGGSKVKRGVSPEETWSVEALEESIRTKQEKLFAETQSIVGGQALHKLSLDEPVLLDASLADLPTTALAWQTLTSAAPPRSRSELLPLPIPLRPRKSRRCRAELAEGRPGILLKPKLNPLEGDSSLRTGHGQWWKKDSSAIHVLPRLQVVTHDSSNGPIHSFLLKITNPTLGPIRLRLGRSNYRGEPAGKEGMATDMKNVLLDSLVKKHADIALDCSATDTLDATELIELESMEDALLELGKSQAEEPETVTSWKPSVGDKPSSKLRWVANQSDTAWFELQIVKEDNSKQVENDSYSAVPVALQIQVGDGSWESSLVKPLQVESPDLATFDVLIVWA